MSTSTKTPVADMTDADIQREWEGFMWADAVGEFRITDAQRARHREVEQEIARRRPAATTAA